MKISKTDIDKLCENITRRLVDKKLLRLKTQRERLKEGIRKVITDELRKEEELDKEVAALIEKNKGVLGKETIDYQKMFHMIKVKLAKEKGVVL
jgi:hypothetical protein